ncbi:MAG: hypothetical protein C1943_11405 [Halochromatium sp.]|nr:hypothetical protein [Halochromatium sp.]
MARLADPRGSSAQDLFTDTDQSNFRYRPRSRECYNNVALSKERLLHFGFSLLFIVCYGATASLAVAEQTCKYDSIRATAPASRFADNGNGTVTDKVTGLQWKRCAEGRSWDARSNACTGNLLPMPWPVALEHSTAVEYAGHDDWRIPNYSELSSIVERACHWPAFNIDVFPTAALELRDRHRYWTSSPAPLGGQQGYIWTMLVDNGVLQSWGMGAAEASLLVRGSP